MPRRVAVIFVDLTSAERLCAAKTRRPFGTEGPLRNEPPGTKQAPPRFLAPAHGQVVRSSKKEESGASGLRQPPGTPQQSIVTALHTTSDKIECHGRHLNGGIKASRSSKRPDQRIGLHGSAGNRGPGRVSIETGCAVVSDRKEDPGFPGWHALSTDNLGSPFSGKLWHVNRFERLRVLRGRVAIRKKSGRCRIRLRRGVGARLTRDRCRRQRIRGLSRRDGGNGGFRDRLNIRREVKQENGKS